MRIQSSLFVRVLLLPLLTGLFTGLLPASSSASQWPQWRGPHGDNVSREIACSPEGKSQPVWSANIGAGYSSPAIANGRLYIAGYFENPETPHAGEDRVFCLNAKTGAEHWSHSYPTQAFDNEHEGGALSTPTVLGDTVFVASRGGGVRAYSSADGDLLWETDLVEEHAVAPGRYGFASSPFILDDLLILNAGRTIALEHGTGETVWISEDNEANYSTVAPLQLGEKLCLAVFGGKGLIVIDSEDGSRLHSYPFRKGPRNVEGATPIVIGETVIISSGYEQGIARIDFSGDEPVELWRNRSMRNKMAGCTLFKEHLYGFDESMLKCLDLEGNELWRKRGLGHGALSIAGDLLLITTSDGELVIAAADSHEFLEESRANVIDEGVFWTAPILAQGFIYVRGSHGHLVCRDHRGENVQGVQPVDSTPIAELPTASELLKRHLSVTGLDKHELPALQLRGRMDNNSLGLHSPEALWEIGTGGLWHERLYVPLYKLTIERFFDGETGWEINRLRGDKLIEGDALQELRSTQGYHCILAPFEAPGGQTTARELYRGVDCYRVEVQLQPKGVRLVYFDAQTGLLAARTSEQEATVVFDDWREVEGVQLPFMRTVFDAESGEEARWMFEEAGFEALDTELFIIPKKLKKTRDSGKR